MTEKELMSNLRTIITMITSSNCEEEARAQICAMAALVGAANAPNQAVQDVLSDMSIDFSKQVISYQPDGPEVIAEMEQKFPRPVSN